MKLSKVIKSMKYEQRYQLENEKDFCYLALAVQKTGFDTCTFLDNIKFLDNISDEVTMVLTTFEIAKQLKDKDYGVCAVDNPRELFFLIHNYLSVKEGYCRKQFKTKIGNNCSISQLSSIAKNNVIIGDNVTIEEFVVVKENTIIGDNTILRAGVKIGGIGFEFKYKTNSILSVVHSGGVIIGKNVEIQNNSCVDKALYPWDDTILGDYTKIDSLVQISHAVKIEGCAMIAGSSIIGGRVFIGCGTWIGFGVSVRNGIRIGKNARANMGAIVTKSIEDGQSVTGNFAIQHDEFIERLKKENKQNKI